MRGLIEAARQGVEERLKQENVTLDVDIALDVDEIAADASRITQILYNLLSNAITFSATGGTVNLSCAREKSMIAFTVEDRGAGIPEDYQHTVFDRFESRAHGSRHRGAGLGLSIVKSLAELHGGTVTLISAPGAGTSVKVLLPLNQEATQLVDEPQYKINRAG